MAALVSQSLTKSWAGGVGWPEFFHDPLPWAVVGTLHLRQTGNPSVEAIPSVVVRGAVDEFS